MNTDLFLLFWIFIGGLLGLISAYSHNSLTKYIVNITDQKGPTIIVFFAFLRVAIVAGILFFVFKNNFIYGIASMVSFIVLQWFCILVLFKDKKGENK